MKMNKMYKGILLAVLGLASVSSIHATTPDGDLIAGFSTGSGNDIVVDLGNHSTLYSGQTWSAATLGISGTTFTWGVIGDTSNGAAGTGPISGLNYLWTTAIGTPNVINSGGYNSKDIGISTIFGNLDNPITGPGSYLLDSAQGYSWAYQTVSGALTTTYHNAYLNPNTSGANTINLYQIVDNGSSPVLEGTFTLNSSGLTFNAVPEPSTYALALLGGVGMLVLSSRKQLGKKA